MSERLRMPQEIDRRDVIDLGLLPALATIGAMAVGFSLVGGVLMAQESVIRSSIVTQVLAMLVMFVLPQFAVGLWVGRKNGVRAGPAVVAGLTPIAVLVLALGAFGGPISTPFQTPLYTAGAVVVWMAACASGMAVGEKLLAPRLEN